MRVLATILAGLAIASGALAAGYKSVIVSFPPGTADSVVQNAKSDFKAQGGEITHEYKLINGFAGKLPEAVTAESVTSLSEKYNATVEEDQVVSATNGDSS